MNAHNIPTDELIQTINDRIDSFLFPHSRIEEIDNEDYWNELGEYLGGYELSVLLKKGIPDGAKWMLYDSEEGEIKFFTCKTSIIETIGVEEIESYFEDNEDNSL